MYSYDKLKTEFMEKIINFKDFSKIIWNLLLFFLSLPHISLSADVSHSLREKKLLTNYTLRYTIKEVDHTS